MRIAFFVSSIGDTDLALSTIKSMEHRGQNATLLIALTEIAEQRINNFQSSSIVLKDTLSAILGVETKSIELCSEEQLAIIIQYIKDKNINYAYFGVPSVNNAIPFQIAEALEETQILMAYEFMFKLDTHCLWQYLPKLKNKPNIHWALPLLNAVDDFRSVDDSKIHITGHLSIDNAYSCDSTRNLAKIRDDLQVSTSSELAFVSGTTQPVSTDIEFLECLLAELPNHPNVQVRLGLHPGRRDLEDYVSAMLTVYIKYPRAYAQFKIILPNDLLHKFARPELSINNPLLNHVFLRIDIKGVDASFAADKVAQAVPGALLNQAAIEGKPSYSHSGKPYLPEQCFANNLAAFFSGTRQPLREREDLGLNEQSVAENYADIITMGC